MVMTKLNEVFIISEKMTNKIRQDISNTLDLIQGELDHIDKNEPQVKPMTIRLRKELEGMRQACALQGHRFEMRKYFKEFMNDVTTLRKATGFKFLTKPSGRPDVDMSVDQTGARVTTPDEKSVVYFFSLVKDLSDLIDKSFEVK
jgi:hypothetical protein